MSLNQFNSLSDKSEDCKSDKKGFRIYLMSVEQPVLVEDCVGPFNIYLGPPERNNGTISEVVLSLTSM